MEKDKQNFFEFQKQLTEKPFSLLESPLFYGAYIKTTKGNALYFKQHHLITDAWSVILTGNRILKYYLLLKKNEDVENVKEPSFFSYFEAERDYLNSKRLEKNRVFWQNKIESLPDFIYLKNKPMQHFTKAKRVSFKIPAPISLKINQYNQIFNTSILVLFAAAFSIYIYKTTSKKLIAFGTTILNRTNFNQKNIIGMFINMIPIYLQVDTNLSFQEFLNYITLNWKDYLANSHYPHNLIMEEYRQKHKTKDNLFDVTINYQNAVHNYPEGFNKIKSYWHPYGYQINSLNIHINHREKLNQFVIDFDYLVELFTDKEIEKLFCHLINILKDALKNPNKTITSLDLLSKKEKKQLIYGFNNSQKIYSRQSILKLFEKQARENPDNTALIFEDRRMTYRELNEKANQTAWMLMSKGVKPNTIVGLLVKRSLEMFIGILGILKAGGAYLPIDPIYPRKRVKDILEDSNCMVLLTTKFIIGNTTWNGEIVIFNSVSNNENRNNPICRNRPRDLAYLIYTSGSTGKPKGVMIEHHSIANTIQWRIKCYKFGPKDVLLQIPPYNFDSSVEDIFSFLSTGATIVVIDQEKRLNLKYLGKLINEHCVTHFLATPLLYNAMLDDIPDKLGHLTSITVAGESVRINMVKKHFAKLPQVKLYNEYGPTENSVCSTVHQFTANDEEVLIGKPISNCRCYVLNQDRKPQPVGIPGELYLGGVGLARGYINNPELTKEKFIFEPTIKEILYKTGDLVKWTPDGNLQFIERIDNQVKIRGFRIELGEIEYNLLKHRSIKETVVVADDSDPNHKCLCAYFVSDAKLTALELKDFLSKRLPDYMIPAYFIPLKNLPLNANGKVDKKALPAPERNLGLSWTPPENEIEEKLVKVWQEVLEVPKVGTNDNFFELGGDSLSIIRIITMIYDEHWELTVQDFYKFNTIKELAAYIKFNQQTIITDAERKKDTEIKIKPDLKTFQRRLLKDTEFSKPRSVKNLLLTGATGFLGSHILFELLQIDVKIYVLVRGINKEDAESRLYQRLEYYFPQLERDFISSKLVIVVGDISKERFGLLESDYQQLLQIIDTVIHTAALVKHFGDYQEFQRINIFGVKNILEFSKSKYLAHISTTSVAGDYTRQKYQYRGLYFDETSLDIGQNLDENYYVKTKYEAEKFVFDEMKEGLNGTVIRVGNLTGRYSDGIFQPNIKENKFYQILKSLVELTVIPNSMAETAIELTPVDLCGKAIKKLLMVEESSGKVFHLMNHNRIKIKDFAQMLLNLGYKIELIKDRLFEKHVQDLLKDKNNFDSLFGIIPDLKNGKLNYSSSVAIDSRYSVEALRQVGFTWPQINPTYIKKIFKHMQSIHFIKRGLKNYRKVL